VPDYRTVSRRTVIDGGMVVIGGTCPEPTPSDTTLPWRVT
jgi:hypothetical protein